MIIDPQTRVYEGMIVGQHTRDNDLVVNVIQGKHLTNIRAAGKDEALALTPPARSPWSAALDYIQADELVEITPKSIRLRKGCARPTSARSASGRGKWRKRLFESLAGCRRKCASLSQTSRRPASSIVAARAVTATFVIPKVAKPVTISGKLGDDAKAYQIRSVRRAVEEAQE